MSASKGPARVAWEALAAELKAAGDVNPAYTIEQDHPTVLKAFIEEARWAKELEKASATSAAAAAPVVAAARVHHPHRYQLAYEGVVDVLRASGDRDPRRTIAAQHPQILADYLAEVNAAGGLETSAATHGGPGIGAGLGARPREAAYDQLVAKLRAGGDRNPRATIAAQHPQILADYLAEVNGHPV